MPVDLAQPAGAHWARVALQVNPWEYCSAHGKTGSFTSEAEYNSALVESAQENGIRAVAITDHNSVFSGASLAEAFAQAGIETFPGFEVVSSETLHFLCIFPPTTPVAEIDGLITKLMSTGGRSRSSHSEFKAVPVAQQCRAVASSMLFVAAHVLQEDGLLREAGPASQARADIWTSPELNAAALDGRQGNDHHRRVLANDEGPPWKRPVSLAIIEAADVHGTRLFDEPTTWSTVRTSAGCELFESVRRAMMHPGGRLRTSDASLDSERLWLRQLTFNGGMFGASRTVAFHSDLSAVIGGRGSGKSTLLMSARFALDPRFDPREMTSLLGPGGKVTAVVQRGSDVWEIERRPGQEPTIAALPTLESASFSAVVSCPDAFMQHELAEVAARPAAQAELLHRLAGSQRRADYVNALQTTREALAANRTEAVAATERAQALASQSADLEAIEAEVERLKNGGVSTITERLQHIGVDRDTLQSSLSRKLVVQERLDAVLDSIAALVPVARMSATDADLADLLSEEDRSLGSLAEGLSAGIGPLLAATAADLAVSQSRLDSIGQLRAQVQAEYDALLGSDGHSDGDRRLPKLQERLATLRQLRSQADSAEAERVRFIEQRARLLTNLTQLRDQAASELEAVEALVDRKTGGLVQVKITAKGDDTEVRASLGSIGLTKAIVDAIASRCLDGREIAELIRTGGANPFNLHHGQAPLVAGLSYDKLLELEETICSPLPEISLRVGKGGASGPDEFRPIRSLSTGQKATAMLALVFCGGTAPLIVDQPEDDLDNAFIAEILVDNLRHAKSTRQVIVATHNANVPVLADAELITCLSARYVDGEPVASIDGAAAIDDSEVRTLVTSILEGGKNAFEERRQRYGF